MRKVVFVRSRDKSGFTIVELLIVVVVIAILAAIVIVAYNGVTKQARESALISDLSNAATIMGVDYATNGTYALTKTAAHGGAGIPSSQGTDILFHSDGTTYCITARSTYDGIDSHYVSSANPTPTKGECPEDAGSSVTTLVGDGTVGAAPGTGTAATLAGPAGIVADSSGNLYFTDQQGSRVRKVTTAGVVTNLFGNGPTGTTEGIGTAALFNWPQAITVGPASQLYVADTNNSRVRVAPLTAGVSTSLLAGSTQGTGGTTGSMGSAVQFNTPRGVVYNPTNHYVYVADSQSNRIRVISVDGVYITDIGSLTGSFADGSRTAARFNYPQGLAVDSSGNVYVADTLNHRIRMIDTAYNVTTIAGGGTAGGTDANGTAARFNSPMAVTVSSNGTLYIADTGNNTIRKVTPSKDVTTIAGNGTAGFKDGNGTDTMFNEPKGIAIGSDGRLYVADRVNNRIRVINI